MTAVLPALDILDQPAGFSAGVQVVEELARWLRAGLSIEVDTNPLDTEEFPQVMLLRPLPAKETPYWQLHRSGFRAVRRGFGNPAAQLLRAIHSVTLKGFWTFSGSVPRHTEWAALTDRVYLAILANPKLNGTAADTWPVEQTGNEVRVCSGTAATQRMKTPAFRYHATTIRFQVVSQLHMPLSALAAAMPELGVVVQ